MAHYWFLLVRKRIFINFFPFFTITINRHTHDTCHLYSNSQFLPASSTQKENMELSVYNFVNGCCCYYYLSSLFHFSSFFCSSFLSTGGYLLLLYVGGIHDCVLPFFSSTSLYLEMERQKMTNTMSENFCVWRGKKRT